MKKIKRRGGNVFEIYSGSGGNNNGGKPTDRTIYRAFGLETTGAYKGQEEWLYIEFGPKNKAWMVRYDQFIRIFSPSNDVVALLLRDEIFFFGGRFVDQIMLPIQDRRLRSIYRFDETFHKEPPTSDAKIARIERQSRAQFERGEQQREG